MNLAPADRRKAGHGVRPAHFGGHPRAPPGSWSCVRTGTAPLWGSSPSPAPCGRWRGCCPWPWPPGRRGSARLFVPADNAAGGHPGPGPHRLPRGDGAASWSDHLAGRGAPSPPPRPVAAGGEEDRRLPDFAEVKGQGPVKRALEIAAAGGHNVLMVGPPGSGKSMLARRLPSILPAMTRREALETTADPLGAGAHRQGAAPADPAALPLPPPHHLPRGDGGGRLPLPPAGGDLPGPQRGAVPGRAAGVSQGRAWRSSASPWRTG